MLVVWRFAAFDHAHPADGGLAYALAVAMVEEVVSRFGEDVAVGVREQVARPPAYEAMTLDDTGREREAAAAFNSVVERFGDDDAEDIRDWPEPAGRRGWAPSDHDRQVTPLRNFAAHRGSN